MGYSNSEHSLQVFNKKLSGQGGMEPNISIAFLRNIIAKMEKKMNAKTLIFPVVLLLLLGLCLASCKDNAKELSEMSPSEIAELYIKFRQNDTHDKLREIVCFPDNDLRLKNLMKSSAEKGLDNLGTYLEVSYEKIINEDTAEVGISLNLLFKHKTPFEQLILKKEEGVWKLYGFKFENKSIEDLLIMLDTSTVDSDVYFYLGRKYSVDRYEKASEYCKKYLALSDNKFWDGPNLQKIIRQGEEIDFFIAEQTKIIDAGPLQTRHATICAKLALAFMDRGDLIKAEKYLNLLKVINDKSSNKARREYYEKIKRELDVLKAK